MNKDVLADKILVLGVDGMDPRYSKWLMDQGKMPNLKKIVERGSAREDLEMMGAQPTVTPPGWTTLATGAYSYTHGITGYDNPGDEQGYVSYSIDSRLCKAEQAWNVFAEAGRKTLVFNWPGSSWPPSLDSQNLHVVDGTQPGTPNAGVAMTEYEFILVASEQNTEVVFKPKAASDSNVPCVNNDLEMGETPFDIVDAKMQGTKIMSISLTEADTIYSVSEIPLDLLYSTLKPAEKWGFEVPEDAKEFVMLFSKGTIRRNCLLLKNAEGKYDHVSIHKNKKTEEPIIVLQNDIFTSQIVDEGLDVVHGTDERVQTNRNMRILDIAEDGSYIKIYVSSGVEVDKKITWWPERLYDEAIEAAGYPSSPSFTGGCDKVLISKVLHSSWDVLKDWQANALHALIEKEQYDVIFSHYHNVDAQSHQLIKYLVERENSKIPPEEMAPLFADIYMQTDEYLGKFLHFLDEGWTILVTSDHGQVCPAHKPPMICDADVSLRVMQELGLTEVKRDADGKELREVDWEKTYAINTRSNHIYLNVKGRDKHTMADGTVIDGIIDPKDQYEWEEEIMTRLYGYKDKKTGKRVIQLALRNRDAMLLGMGGDRAGDILIWTAEGYNYDHNDALSTCYGEGHTSMNCIFAAAGPGIKEGYTTTRVIRQVDFAPTLCVLGGVRMPNECEGAPIYQILSKKE